MPNPNIPSVDITIKSGLGAIFAQSGSSVAVFGCCEKGPLNTPTLFSDPVALLDVHGFGDAVELVAKLIAKGAVVLFTRLPNTQAGVNSIVDTDAVTGTSVVSLSGTPLVSIQSALLDTKAGGILEVITGGTISTAGIVVRYSLDGGVTYSPNIALGTADSLAIPGTGLTLDFAAGTLIAGDVATWRSEGPRWASSDFAAAFDAVKAGTNKFRLGVVAEAFDSDTELQDFGAELDQMETEIKRMSRGLTAARDRYPDVRVIGEPQITFDDVGGSIDRDAGSFVTDGFQVGQTVMTDSATNPGPFEITAVAALSIDVTPSPAAEGPGSFEVTATEKETDWINALRTEYDPFSDERVAMSAGPLRMRSELRTGHVFRRVRCPVAWAAAVRFVQHDYSQSLADFSDGSALDDDGFEMIEGEHDSRVTAGLASKDGSAGRFVTAQTRESEGARAFVCLPSIMHPVGSDYSRLHLGFLADHSLELANAYLTRRLSSGVITRPGTGFIDEGEALDIEDGVRQQFDEAILRPNRPPGERRASAMLIALGRTTNLTIPGATEPAKLTVQPKGYLEGFALEFSLSVAVGGVS